MDITSYVTSIIILHVTKGLSVQCSKYNNLNYGNIFKWVYNGSHLVILETRYKKLHIFLLTFSKILWFGSQCWG